jgi:hypothetical protein
MIVLREMKNNIEIIHFESCRIQIEEEEKNIKDFFDLLRELK